MRASVATFRPIGASREILEQIRSLAQNVQEQRSQLEQLIRLRQAPRVLRGKPAVHTRIVHVGEELSGFQDLTLLKAEVVHERLRARDVGAPRVVGEGFFFGHVAQSELMRTAMVPRRSSSVNELEFRCESHFIDQHDLETPATHVGDSPALNEDLM